MPATHPPDAASTAVGDDFVALFGPRSAEEFGRALVDRIPRVVRGHESQFARLVTWQDINVLVDSTVADPRTFVVLGVDGPVAATEYTRSRQPGGDRFLDPVRLQQRLSNGATLQINRAQHVLPSAAVACRVFAGQFGSTSGCNVFLSHAATGVTPPHWDADDAFFLQLAGAKHWRVYQPRRPDPLAGEVEPSPDYLTPPFWEGTLRAGDALYVPRGWFHVPGEAPGQPLSLHLTIGLAPRTGIDLGVWLFDQLRSVHLFRQELPRYSHAAVQRDHARRLWAELERRWSDDIIGAFLTHDAGAARPQGRSSLPWSLVRELPEENRFRVASATPRRITPNRDGDHLVVWATGRRWELDPQLEPVLLPLLAGEAVAIVDLPRFVTPTLPLLELRKAIVQLVEDGLLCIEAP